MQVVANADAAVPLLLSEVRNVLARGNLPLISFATGGTFGAFFRALATEVQQGRISTTEFIGTHLDEYIAYEPQRRGGMVHELTLRCPPLREMLARGTFLPVPCHGAEGSMRAHEERLQRAGGVKLQLLGIGRNGHIAFNEPGTPLDTRFHVTELAESTRLDARSRFVPDEPPKRAVTSGVQTILGGERLVLCAFGQAKAEAVRSMLHGDVSSACPASVLQRHPNALVLLDTEAASLLEGNAAAAGG
ncbi:MAG: 6-phosphogluconolactonase [Planctomycetes bacterium]|nr:6-phosphogluconolactonase [Planctomycetota bacterium]